MMYRNHPLFYNEFITKPVGGKPLDSSLIYGVDTESFHSIQLNRLHTNMVGVSGVEGDYLHEPALNESPFGYLINPIFEVHSKEMKGDLRASHTEMCKDENGKWKKGRAKIPVVLIAFYNLEYDFQRLFNEDSHVYDMARINVEGMKCTEDDYEIENVHLVLSGSAPHFTWILRKNNRILKVYALDLWGYMKVGLGKSAKALGIIDKLEVDKEYFHIPLEQLTDEQLNELRVYAKRDPKVTRELYLALLYFLTQFSEDVVTKKGILPPSASAAAARIAFSKMKGKMLQQPPKMAIQMALDAYNGGMVFCRATGEFENILVGDRNSAYPTMMTLLPDPEQVRYLVVYKVKPDDLIGKIGFVRASFEIESDYIPFITSHDEEGNSTANHAPGRYQYHTMTIYELMAGYLVGTIKHITIHEALYLKYEPEAMGTGIFHDHVKNMHRVKNESEKGSALYLLAKSNMNNLYGKLIEMRNPEALIIPEYVRKLRVPTGVKYKLGMDKQYRHRFYNSLLNKGIGLEDILNEYEPTDWDGWISIEECVTELTLTAGTYFFPFYASLITGGQRAWMSVYTHFTKAILADTDSAFSPLTEPEFISSLEKASRITERIGVGKCQIGKELGDIDIELRNGKGFISGIKQYSLVDVDNKDKRKIAHHAILPPQKLEDGQTYEDFFTYVISELSKGHSVTYQVKSKPVRIRTALMRGYGFGRFETSQRTITAKADKRLAVVAKRGKITYYRWKKVDELKKED